MRRQVVIATALLFALLAAAPLSAGEFTRTLRVELSADVTRPFAVENLAGTMRVVSGSGETVVAVATVHAEIDAHADAMRFEKVTGEDGMPTLRVRYPLDEIGTIRYPRGGGDGGWLSRLFSGSNWTSTRYDGARVKVRSGKGDLLYADVEVQLPRRVVEATFRNHVGLLRGENIEGTLTFDGSSTDVKLESVRGTIRVDTGSGDVSITDAEGSIRCHTGSGDCDLRDIQGETIACDVGSGDISIRSSSVQTIDVDTGSGDVRVLDTEVREFSADTGSGDVMLQADGVRLERVTTDTGSGDVVLRLGPDASFEARADLGSGDIISRYTDSDAIVRRREVVGYRRGDGRTRIEVDTGSGDLVIEPGGSTARKR